MAGRQYKADRKNMEGKEARDMKTMESIHIDLSKKIFLLNGRPMRDVSELHLDFEKGEWSLQVTETATYTEQRPNESTE